jgi:Invasin, domain 3
LVSLLMLALCPEVAGAATIESFTTATSTSQSGAHPDLSASFSFGESETVKALQLETPAGLFINPSAVPRCSGETFAGFECPPSTQVGLITTRVKPAGEPAELLGTAPVYAIEPEAGETARLGFVLPGVDLPVEMPVTVRASDYGLSFQVQGFPQAVPLAGANLTLWGAPSDPIHDPERFAAGTAAEPAGCPGIEGTGCIAALNPTNVQSRPLLQNPTACTGALASELSVNTYQHPSEFVIETASIEGTVGCHKNAFEPTLLWGLTTAQTRTPSGLDIDLRQWQPLNPNGIAPAEIRDVTVALPPELRIDPEAAAAQVTCTDAQFGSGTQAPETCPTASKVGTFSLAPAGFEAPLEGAVYLGTSELDGTPRLLMTAHGAGIATKLVGLLHPDAGEGEASVVLTELPPLPLEEIELSLGAGPGLLVTPTRCGVQTATATVTPWDASQGAFLAAGATQLDSVGPDGGPCPGPAAHISLSLSPGSIVADDSASSLATATVTDADGIAVPGDEVSFSSSDPAEQISPVSDHGDGTYTARIGASTTAGPRTITAADLTAGLGVFGTAALTQIAPAPHLRPIGAPLPAVTGPRLLVTIARKPTRQTHDRTPTFRFDSSEPGSAFACRIDGEPFRTCSSPMTLPRLGLGAHTFGVRATDAAGQSSEAATFKFTVRGVAGQKHRARSRR